VEQRAAGETERRRDPRSPRAFAFWLRPEHAARRVSGWMLDVSAGGAAFLTAAGEAPPIGVRVELSEMPTRDRVVREDAQPLPRFGRVLRHDEPSGVTRRIAVRFEADVESAAQCSHSRAVQRVRTAPVPPPVPPPAAGPPAPVRRIRRRGD